MKQGIAKPGIVAPLPSLPLWLAVSLALAAEGAMVAGLAVWPAPHAIPSPSAPIEVSLVSVPVPLESAAAGGLSSVAIAAPEPEPALPEPPIAPSEPAPLPVALAPAKPAPDRKPRSKPKPTVTPKSKPKPALSPPSNRSLVSADRASVGKVKRTARGKDPNAGAASGTEQAARSGSSSPAAYLDNPAPGYPETARRMRQEGTVSLKVLANASGQAAEVTLVASSGIPSLDQAALRAVRRWRFVPARQNGQPIASWVRIPIRFKLDR